MDDCTIRTLANEDLEPWDRLVAASRGGTVFHTSPWIRTCSDLLSTRAIVYGCFREDELLAGCSLYTHSSYGIFKTAVSTAVMSPYGGYVFAAPESTKVREIELVTNAILAEMNRSITGSFDYVRLVNPPEFVDIRPFIRDGWNARVEYAYHLDLTSPIEERISRNVRRSVRKAEKLGISIGPDHDGSLFEVLTRRTYERQGLPSPVPPGFLPRMIDMIVANGLGEMWVARTPEGVPAAAEIVVWDTWRAHRWAAALDPEFKATGATSLLLVGISKHLQARGVPEINLMGANTHLTDFISSFNPRLVPYYAVDKARGVRRLLNRVLGRA
jgi:hypothetical protein